MSKFVDSQFSISGIKNFSLTTSYDQYDLVDFQYYTGNSSYPTNLSGLFAWFNLDNLNNLEFDGSGRVNVWYNSAPGHSLQYLINIDSTAAKETRPVFNDQKNCLSFKAFNENQEYNQLYTSSDFSGFLSDDRCWFIVYEFDSLRYGYQTVDGYYSNFSTILNTDDSNPVKSSGYLGVYGNNSNGILNPNVPNGSEEFVGGPAEAVYPSASTINSAFSSAKLLNNKNIVSIIKNNTTNALRIRNNGYEILNINSSNYFHANSDNLRLGTAGNGHGNSATSALYNYDASNISYYEMLGYSKVPTDDQILEIEKYLFKKHFTNDDNLYLASQDFTASDYRYSPINITGSQFLTKNIDSLFKKTYGCSASFSTKTLRMQYGDGYYTNVTPNVNNLTSNFTLTYDGLSDIQSKALIGFFQNTFEYAPLNIEESYQSVNMDLFYPYKNNAKIYFENLSYASKESNLNSVNINCVSAYNSCLDYRGFLVTGVEVTREYKQEKTYVKDDVVFLKNADNNVEGYYWYTGTSNAILNDSTSPTGSNSLFTNKFYFKPDIDYSIPVSPRFLKNEYEMTAPAFENDGINKTVLTFDFAFNNRSDKETIALLKFLDNKAGFKIFEIDLPAPYNKTVNVYCPEWSHTYKFYNNHDISAKFLEFKGKTDSDIFFNTLLQL
jgi:phage-related protein